VNIIFQIEDTDGNILNTYYTGNIPDMSPDWKNYGFEFTVPAGQTSMVLRIINNGAGYLGNDFAMDDIEIRFCAPKVETYIPGNDTIICYGNPLDISGTYTADCTFGNELAYRWEFRHLDSVNWKTLSSGAEIINCATSPTITKPAPSITSATKAAEGYYRLLISSTASINSVNCRAASDSIYVHIVDKYVAPDLRIQVCPSPPNHAINMSGYLDSTDYDRVSWANISPFPPVSAQGVISGNFNKGATYTYKYTVLSPEYSGCGSSTAKVYIRTLNDHIFGKIIDTVEICIAYADSRSVNLNQIFGLALGGSITLDGLRDPDGVAANNIRTLPSSSQYAGSTVFNAQKAYTEADDSYDIPYKGVVSKRFDFVYTSSSCVIGTKRVVLIVRN
jgi:hypothetical protein